MLSSVQARTRIRGAHREWEKRLKPLGTWIFSKSRKKSTQDQEGAQQLSDRAEKEIWTIDFYIQEGRSGGVHKENWSEPTDLE